MSNLIDIDILIDDLNNVNADKLTYCYEVKKDGKSYEFKYSIKKIKEEDDE